MPNTQDVERPSITEAEQAQPDAGAALIRLASEAYEDTAWFFELLKQLDASPFQTECAELLVEGHPPSLIAHKTGRSKREVRLALDQVRQRLSQRVYEFDAEPAAFARFLKFCIRNKSNQELAAPDVLASEGHTRAYARVPGGADMLPASDVRLRQSAFDAIRLFVEARLTPEADRLAAYVNPKRVASNGAAVLPALTT